VSQAAALSGGDGPALGVGNSFPIWKEGGGRGGPPRVEKKLFDPMYFFRIPSSPWFMQFWDEAYVTY
jgi:hypothetical protein